MINFVFICSYIIFIIIISSLLRKVFPNNKELLRKIIHIGLGPLIPFAKYLDLEFSLAQYIAGGITILILINYIYQLIPTIEDIDRKSFGTLFYCLSLFILITFYWDKDPWALTAGYFIMAFGDGFAGLIGKNFKSKSWVIFDQKKSLLGTSTMFIISFLVLTILGSISNFDFNFYYFFIALISTSLEQISILGIDNLSVPIAAAFTFNLFVTKL